MKTKELDGVTLCCCGKCEVYYPRENMAVDKRNKSGLRALCRPCDYIRCIGYRAIRAEDAAIVKQIRDDAVRVEQGWYGMKLQEIEQAGGDVHMLAGDVDKLLERKMI